MEITDVSVTTLGVQLDENHGISKGRSSDYRPAAIVTVETDAGITGIGEGYGPTPQIVETIVEDKFADALVGEDALDRERLWQAMVTEYTYWDQKGQGISAASGVDLALWDIAGKYHDAPVHQLLGGTPAGTARYRPTRATSSGMTPRPWPRPRPTTSTGAFPPSKPISAVASRPTGPASRPSVTQSATPT